MPSVSFCFQFFQDLVSVVSRYAVEKWWTERNGDDKNDTKDGRILISLVVDADARRRDNGKYECQIGGQKWRTEMADRNGGQKWRAERKRTYVHRLFN